MLATEDASLNPVSWQRFIAPDLFTSSGFISKEQFHVPLA